VGVKTGIFTVGFSPAIIQASAYLAEGDNSLIRDRERELGERGVFNCARVKFVAERSLLSVCYPICQSDIPFVSLISLLSV